MPKAADRIAVQRLLAREHHAIQRAFFAFVGKLRSAQVLNHVLKMTRSHGAEAGVRVIEPALKWFAKDLSLAFIRAGHDEFTRLQHVVRVRKSVVRTTSGAEQSSIGPGWVRGPALDPVIRKQPEVGVSFAFDPGDEEASLLMSESELRFIKDFSDDQRATVRDALQEQLDKGYSPRKAARSFRDSIGLTQAQSAAVRNYRSLLETGSSEALDRGLRDARYDRTLNAALERGDVLSDNQIDTMVGRYADNMLASRADAIALTESHRAVSEGRQQALSQLADRYDISEDDITRTWNTKMDGRERKSHADMDGQQVTGFEPFMSPSGATLQYPGDPMAPAEETIRCRCLETYEINTGG